jgi:hypothetical protein
VAGSAQIDDLRAPTTLSDLLTARAFRCRVAALLEAGIEPTGRIALLVPNGPTPGRGCAV